MIFRDFFQKYVWAVGLFRGCSKITQFKKLYKTNNFLAIFLYELVRNRPFLGASQTNKFTTSDL